MTTEHPSDLTYGEALAAAAPRLAELQVRVTALLDQAQAFVRDAAAAIRVWMDQVAPLFARLWSRIVAWIQRQGMLSPALAYATPRMRRRAAKQRARLVTRRRQSSR
ncbi:MAG TPA: hypothetical protein VE338_21245 [Ktedonobacterales bacterium]|jgi:hypothetical protein|nr:hypothetical protein [Ktedonobacterales bacterium]